MKKEVCILLVIVVLALFGCVKSGSKQAGIPRTRVELGILGVTKDKPRLETNEVLLVAWNALSPMGIKRDNSYGGFDRPTFLKRNGTNTWMTRFDWDPPVPDGYYIVFVNDLLGVTEVWIP